MNQSILFPEISPAERERKLAVPHGQRIAMVLDTDTYNEIDDQFAVAYAVRASDKIDLRAVTAAPFFNPRSESPADGMERSYLEILHLLKLLKRPAENFAFRGAAAYLPDAQTPVDSPAARRIIELARDAASRQETLYVCGIAAITNIASAILLAPDIVRHIVVVWLGGHPEYLHYNREFNLYQDVPAVQAVLDSGVPFIRVPCLGVAELLMTTLGVLQQRLAGSGELGEFLYRRCEEYMKGDTAALKVIWDIAVPAYFLLPEAFVTEVIPTPVLHDDLSWETVEDRPPMRVVRHIGASGVFQSLFDTLRN